MAITLSRLCDGCDTKYNMNLIAGKNGMSNTVRWVHMIEDAEVPDFLYGNELIFTTGIGHISGLERLLKFVQNLKEHGAVGVCINLGPYIKDIPPLVSQYCDENDFPLFTLPWKVHIIDITFDFCTRIIENDKRELTLAEAFQSLIIDKSSLAKNIKVFENAGFNLSKPFRVIACKLRQNRIDNTVRIEQKNRLKLWKILTQSNRAATVFVHDNTIIVIRQDLDERQLEFVCEQLEKSCAAAKITFAIGVSNEDYGYGSVSRLYSEARAALVSGECDGRQTTLYDSIGVDKLLCAVGDRRIIDSYVDGVIGKIRDYDKLNGTDYLNILKTYLDSGCSVQLTADKLLVHRNTVNYQIKQIKKIFGIEFTESMKMNLNLAFRIIKLIKGVNEDESAGRN